MIVLIVEDDSNHNLTLTKLVREKCSIEPVSVFSVAGARAILQNSTQTKAIVCDYQLPDGTAEDVIRHLSTRGLEIPFILYGDTIPDLQKFETGFFVGHVDKSSPEEICEKIRRLKES